MDPEPNLTFLECSKTKPYISYEEENGIKTFSTINMNDDNNTIVFSKAHLDERYKLLYGEVTTLTLSLEEYMAIKKAIKNGLKLIDLVHYQMHPLEISSLKTKPNEEKFEILVNDKMVEIPSKFSTVESDAIEDKNLRSKPDRINNYIIKYNSLSGLPTDVFKEIEQEQVKKQPKVVVIPKTYRKIKSA